MAKVVAIRHGEVPRLGLTLNNAQLAEAQTLFDLLVKQTDTFIEESWFTIMRVAKALIAVCARPVSVWMALTRDAGNNGQRDEVANRVCLTALAFAS